LHQEFPQSPLYLILGTDAFFHIQSWHRWDELLNLAHIVVMQRSGEKLTMPEQLLNWYQDNLATDESKQLAGYIWPVTVSQLEISATAIRAKIKRGLNPQFLLAETVIQYIGKRDLYQK